MQNVKKVIDRLEDHYRKFSIPDSIRQRVDDEVATVLDTTKINVTEFSEDNWNTANVSELEFQLKSLLKIALIARAREDEKTLQELMTLAQKMAEDVDSGTEAEYWVPFVAEINTYSNEKAGAWLKAEKALSNCKQFQDSDYIKAENYASLAFKHIQKANDERLRLDIMNRFQLILYPSRGMADLSIALSEQPLKDAIRVNDHLRANGIMLKRAEALDQRGEIERALELFKKVRERAERYAEVPFMSWHKTNALLQMAGSYWNLSQFENALNVLDEVEDLNLSPHEKVQLHNQSGDVHQRIGNYETAELEFKAALNLADPDGDITTQIIILTNLGSLNHSLTEYDLALNYFYKAKNILEERSSENYESRINLIISIANVMVDLSHSTTVDSLITEANRLSRLVNTPRRNADLSNTIGNFNLNNGNYHSAYSNFQEAFSICKDNGLIRPALLTQLNLAESLIRLSKFSQARKELLEALSLAEQIDDSERIIDAIAKLAKLEKSEGNIANAVTTSKRLIPEIEKIFARLHNENRMISFMQKIYGYLKEAVIYELHYQRADSAYALLDYAKTRSFKNQKDFSNGHLETNGNASHFINIETLQSRLKENNFVLDYLLGDDSLYVFVLDHKKLLVLTKALDAQELKTTVASYKESIEKTMNLFEKDYNETSLQAHFDSTNQLSQKLFEQLMGWPSLISKIKEVECIYLVPDEFLYDLPFSTLLENVSEKRTFLVQNAAIVTLPGASFIQSVGGSSDFGNLQEKRILVSADPDIPGSRDFVAFIKDNFPLAEVLSVNKYPFNKKDVLAKLNEGHDIYIFLGHGSANPTYPDLSFIQLSATNSISSDIKTFQVTISDLRQMNWPGAEMVMLVGCETGRGKLYRGTGIVGLQQGFVSMGSQNVLASLWKIDARKAIPQIKNFIRYLSDYSDPAMALKESQLESIQELVKSNYYKKPHPYYWGSFILSSKTN